MNVKSVIFSVSFWFQGMSISWIPACLFGIVSLLAGIISSILPETAGKDLPDSIQKLRGNEEEETHL